MKNAPCFWTKKRASYKIKVLAFRQMNVLLNSKPLTRRDFFWGGYEQQYFQKVKFIIASKILN